VWLSSLPEQEHSAVSQFVSPDEQREPSRASPLVDDWWGRLEIVSNGPFCLKSESGLCFFARRLMRKAIDVFHVSTFSSYIIGQSVETFVQKLLSQQGYHEEAILHGTFA